MAVNVIPLVVGDPANTKATPVMLVDSAGNPMGVGFAMVIGGPAADDAAATGNPVLVGGKYEATPNTVEDGDASFLKVDANGRLLTSVYAFDVTSAPTVTNGAYTAGDVIGGYQTVTLARANDEAFMITGIQVAFKAAVTPNIRVIIFGGTPDATLADNAAFTLSAANALLVRRSLSSSLLGVTYNSLGTPKEVSLVPPLPIIMKPISGGRTIGYYLVDDSGITLTSTSDMQIRFTGAGL